MRKNVDSAAREHGTCWQYLRNDFAMHNIILLPKMQQMLAQYEPLAFRSLIEVCGSHVPPPPPPPTATIPAEAYYLPFSESCNAENDALHSSTPENTGNGPAAHPSSRVELRRSIERMKRAMEPCSSLNAEEGTVESWMDAWKEFDVAK